MVKQLKQDEHALLNNSTSSNNEVDSNTVPLVKRFPLSLCAKYCPREKSKFHRDYKKPFKALVAALFSDNTDEISSQTLLTKYRQMISRLTAALDVVEVKMSNRQYSTIDFSKVPAICLYKCRKAFLNEHIKLPPIEREYERGNRHTSMD